MRQSRRGVLFLFLAAWAVSGCARRPEGWNESTHGEGAVPGYAEVTAVDVDVIHEHANRNERPALLLAELAERRLGLPGGGIREDDVAKLVNGTFGSEV